MPSGLVITRLPLPVQEKATNRPLPYVTEDEGLSTGVVLDVQDSPAANDETRPSRTAAVAGDAVTSSRAANKIARAKLRSLMLSGNPIGE